MGVKGFWQYLERFLDFHELMKELLVPGDSVLLIDGNNLMFDLMKLKVKEDTNTTLGSPIDGRYGGSYLDYRDIIIREFSKLQNLGFKKLEVFFDGNSPPLKSFEVISRNSADRAWESLYDILISEYSTFDVESLPLPILTKCILEIVLLRDFPDVVVTYCRCEADVVMGKRCKELNEEDTTRAYIYSNDSDFAVMTGCALMKIGMFHDSAYQLASRQDGFDILFYPVEVWRRDKVRKLLGLDDGKFIEFLLMLGSDFTSSLPRQELRFYDVPQEILDEVGELNGTNNGTEFDKLLYLVKNSGDHFRVHAPQNTPYPGMERVQEYALEYTRQFWNLTLDQDNADQYSKGLIDSISDIEMECLLERARKLRSRYYQDGLDSDGKSDHESDDAEDEDESTESSEEEDDGDETASVDTTISGTLSEDEESVDIVQPEFSDEILSAFEGCLNQNQDIEFNSIPLLVIDFLESLTVDMYSEQMESINPSNMLALKISLFATFMSESSDVRNRQDVLDQLHGRLSDLPQDRTVFDYFRINEQNGQLDMSACYKVIPSFDDFVMAHFYQTLVKKCIRSRMRSVPEFATDGIRPELFFNGPLFHYICKRLSNDEINATEAESTEKDEASNDKVRTSAEDYRNDVFEKLRSDRLIFISGETGCGKSSRIPAFIVQHCRNEGKPCRVLICEPKRLAAEKLYRYLSSSGDALGLGEATLALRMGLGVREGPDNANITLATSGYVCQRFIGDSNNAFTHIIIDEIHERTVDIDLLFMWTRALLRSDRSVKILLMSATPEYKIFRPYYRNYLQCPLYLVDPDGVDANNNDVADDDERMQLLNNGLGDLVPLWVGHTPRSREIYFIEDLKRVRGFPKPFDRLIFPSFLKTRDNIIEKCRRVGITARMLKCQIDIAARLITLCTHGKSVLVFVAGRPEIDNLRNRLSSNRLLEVFEVHGDLDEEQEARLLDPIPGDKIRVFLATNAAESSVTLPAVEIVIDFGTNNVETYDSGNFARTLLKTTWISKSSSKQRAGRTGRLTDGTVYRLYTRRIYRRHCSSEIAADVVRKPLHDAMIRVLSNFNGHIPGRGGLRRVFESLIQVPEMSHREDSLNYLFEGKLITDNTEQCELTRLGHFASMDGIGTQLSRLIFYGIILGIGPQCLILAAALIDRSRPFRGVAPEYCSPDEYNKILKDSYMANTTLDDECYSEPIMLLQLYKKLRSTNARGIKQICNDFNLHDAKAKKFYSTANALMDRVNLLLRSWNMPVLEFHQTNIDRSSVELMRIALLWSSDGSVMRVAQPPVLPPESAKFSSILFRLPISERKISQIFPGSSTILVQRRLLHILRLERPYTVNLVQDSVEMMETLFRSGLGQFQGFLVWFKSFLMLGSIEQTLNPACEFVIKNMMKRTSQEDDPVVTSYFHDREGQQFYYWNVDAPSLICHDHARELLQVFETFCEVIFVDENEDSNVFVRSFGVDEDTSHSVVDCLVNALSIPLRSAYSTPLNLPTFKVVRFPIPDAEPGDVLPSPMGMNFLNFLTSRSRARKTLCVGSLSTLAAPANANQSNVSSLIKTNIATERAKWEILNVQSHLQSALLLNPLQGDQNQIEQTIEQEQQQPWGAAHTDSWSTLMAMHPRVAGRPDRSMYAVTNYSIKIEKGDFRSVRCEQVTLLPYPFEWIEWMMSIINPSWRSSLRTRMEVADPTLQSLAAFIDESISTIAQGDQELEFNYNIPLRERVLDFHRKALERFDERQLPQEIIPLEEEIAPNNVQTRFLIPNGKVGLLIGKGGSRMRRLQQQFQITLQIDTEVMNIAGDQDPIPDWSMVTVRGRNRLFIRAATGFITSMTNQETGPILPPPIENVISVRQFADNQRRANRNPRVLHNRSGNRAFHHNEGNGYLERFQDQGRARDGFGRNNGYQDQGRARDGYGRNNGH